MCEKKCENCQNYNIKIEGTYKDHESELLESVGELPGLEDLFDDNGHLKNPDEPFNMVFCIKGHLDDESNFFTNPAPKCKDFVATIVV
jgi:hypothetical protein